MSSVVDICNIALSHLGDTATVASIDPPEGSAQAEHCARFYPIARDTALEMHPWSFATRRALLALLTDTNDQWDYVYALPNKTLKVLAVLASDVGDDYVVSNLQYTRENVDLSSAYGVYTPQPFCVETLASGQRVVLTNQEDALIRYTESITDSQKFSPLFTMSLSWLLASMLAGPILKGDVGAAEGKRCLQMFTALFSQARISDSDSRNIKPFQVVSWMAGR